MILTDTEFSARMDLMLDGSGEVACGHSQHGLGTPWHADDQPAEFYVKIRCPYCEKVGILAACGHWVRVMQAGTPVRCMRCKKTRNGADIEVLGKV